MKYKLIVLQAGYIKREALDQYAEAFDMWGRKGWNIKQIFQYQGTHYLVLLEKPTFVSDRSKQKLYFQIATTTLLALIFFATILV